jgi:hypothetical protein
LCADPGEGPQRRAAATLAPFANVGYFARRDDLVRSLAATLAYAYAALDHAPGRASCTLHIAFDSLGAVKGSRVVSGMLDVKQKDALAQAVRSSKYELCGHPQDGSDLEIAVPVSLSR